MAASNYYGFVPGTGPQYSTQPATAYSHSSTATNYSVQPNPGVSQAVTPSYVPTTPMSRQISSVGFGGYQAHAGQDYSYSTRQQEPTLQPSTALNYQDNYCYGRSTSASSYENKPYYQLTATQAQHTATDSYYQSGTKGGYSQSSSGYSQTQPQRQVTTIKPVQTVSTTSSSYNYPAVKTVQPNVPGSSIPSYTPSSSYSSNSAQYTGSNYSSYDASVYSGADTYYPTPQQLQPPPQALPQPQPITPQQQHPQPPPQPLQPPSLPKPTGPSPWANMGCGTSTSSVSSFPKKPPFQNKQLKPKGPLKQPQLYYCDICKISCAGPQTYREHLEGQKHKKKEAAQKLSNQSNIGLRGVQTQLHCELCDVSCTGADAYTAHIRGSKHQKKKVNPELPVEIKPSNRARKHHEEKIKKQKQKDMLKQWQEQQRRHKEMRLYEKEIYWRRVGKEHLYWEEPQRQIVTHWNPPPLMSRPGILVPSLLQGSRRPNTSDDRHIMSKHSTIYPTETELQAIHKVVSHSERALKLVSDILAEEKSEHDEEGGEKGKINSSSRILKGVMRVGILAKGLLLRGDRNVHLILLSAEKPTQSLLQKITEQLPKQLLRMIPYNKG